LEINLGCLKDVEVRKPKGDKNYTIVLTEVDGNYYGSLSEIKIPAKSYEMLEKEIVDKWLDKQKI
jgi:L-rhamnose mutarotase